MGSPIRVTVSPDRSAYFAGEQIVLTVAFTNTRSVLPHSDRVPSSPTPSHKRASHSISAAPLSRPPTSPGTPRPSSPGISGFPRADDTKPCRKGSIGIRSKARSLSVEGRNAWSHPTALYDIPRTPKSPRWSTTIDPDHPHARKNSLDVKAMDVVSGNSNENSEYTSSLESISEGGAPSKSPAYPNALSSHLRAAHSHSRRTSLPSLGRQKDTLKPPVKSVSAAYTTPGTEHLNYAFAQFIGTIAFDAMVDSGRLRKRLRRVPVLGGGRMDISAIASPAEPDELPTFEQQPGVFFTDCYLPAGESKIYTYEILLPECLPPTYKGRMFKLDYYVLLGISRARSPLDSETPDINFSRIMKVPLRIYGNVRADAPPKPYDISWPTLPQRLQAASAVLTEKVQKMRNSSDTERFNDKNGAFLAGALQNLSVYAYSLMQRDSDPLEGRQSTKAPELQPEAGVEVPSKGCREAIDIRTRLSKRLSYDIRRQGYTLASLNLVKPAYRLGESISGLVDLNARDKGWGRVLQISVHLETRETLPPGVTIKNQASSPTTHSRVHAEFAASNLQDVRRVSFTLDIPSDASPAFELVDSTGQSTFTSGLDWKLNVKLQVGLPPARHDNQLKGRNQRRSLLKDGSQSEWGFCYTACDDAAPLERVGLVQRGRVPSGTGWMSFLSPGYFARAGEHIKDIDGKDSEELEGGPVRWKGKGREGEIGEDGLGGSGEWSRTLLERVEFEVPLTVWPGNTAFRPTEVVFEV